MPAHIPEREVFRHEQRVVLVGSSIKADAGQQRELAVFARNFKADPVSGLAESERAFAGPASFCPCRTKDGSGVRICVPPGCCIQEDSVETLLIFEGEVNQCARVATEPVSKRFPLGEVSLRRRRFPCGEMLISQEVLRPS